MNLWFIFLLLSTASNGGLSKRTWWKRHVPLKNKTTKSIETSAFTKTFDDLTAIISNSSISEAISEHPNGSTNSTNFSIKLLTPKTNLHHSKINLEDYTGLDNTTLASTIAERFNTENANVVNTKVDNAKIENATMENSEFSGIIVYAPKEDDSFSEEHNSLRKFQKFLISFFTKFWEHNETPLEIYKHSGFEESINTKRRDLSDIIAKGKEIVADASKTAIKGTQDTVKNIQDVAKKIVGRNATYLLTDASVSSQSHSDYSNTAIGNNTNLALTNASELSKETQPSVDATFTQQENKSTPSETRINFIDKNTKYFFGEANTNSETIHTTHAIAESESTNILTDVKEQELVNTNTPTIATKTGDLQVHKCNSDHCTYTHTQRGNSTSDSNNTISQDDTKNTDNTLTVSHQKSGLTTNMNAFTNEREDFFKYKNWLWQHLAVTRNGSAKSNSTEGFRKAHHFLLNSGGTEQSTTDTSEFFITISQKKTEMPEMKQDLYRALLEEHNLGQNLKLQPDFPLKRHRRIRRNLLRSPTRNSKSKNMRIKNKEGEIEDQEVTLPISITDTSTFVTKLDTVEEAQTTLTTGDIGAKTAAIKQNEDESTTTLSHSIETNEVETTTTLSHSTGASEAETRTGDIEIESYTTLSGPERQKNISEGTTFAYTIIVLKEPEKPKPLPPSDLGYDDGNRTKPWLLLVTVPSFLGE